MFNHQYDSGAKVLPILGVGFFPATCARVAVAAFVALIVFFGAAGFSVAQPVQGAGTENPVRRDSLRVVGVDGVAHDVQVEVAWTPVQRAVGLMNRQSLDEGAGMLFDFGRPEPVKFWMKNTLIPLDMLFMDQTGRVVHIEADVQPHDLTPRGPDFPVLAVLELAGGMAEKLGITVGAQVSHDLFKRSPEPLQ